MKTILVVDNETASAEVLSLILEEEGYRVHCATDVRQGLERVAELRPDLLIVEHRPPRLDGAAFGRTLRASFEHAHIPLVVHTSLTEEELREQFDGYDGFLRKPYHVDAALALIRRLLATEP